MNTHTNEIFSAFRAGKISLDEVYKMLKSLKDTPAKDLLSEGQKGLWTLQKTFPEMTAYNVPICYRVNNLNVEMFRKACRHLVKQHPILNTAIREENGIPYQIVLPEKDPVLQQEDLSGLAPDQMLSYLNQKAKQVFILEEGPLFRIHLLSMSNQETIVLMNVHHIVFDGSSLLILVKTLFDAYQAFIDGKEPIYISLSATYRDFVKEEQKLLQSEDGASRLLYWQRQLVEPLPHLSLPTDQPRSLSRNYFEGRTYSQRLSSELSEQIKLFSEGRQTYLSTVFMGLFKVLLYKYTDQSDIIVGMPVNGRNQERFNQVIGFLINMVPMRSYISSKESFVAFLNQLQKTIVNGMAHNYPFSALVRELNLSAVAGSAPVFQVAFVYQDFFEGIDGHKLPIRFVEGIHQEGEYEIVLEVIEQKDNFALHWKYNPELFDENTIVRMVSHYTKLIEDVMMQPALSLAEYSLLSDAEKKVLLLDRNNTRADYPKDKCVHELFEEQAKKTPQAIALLYEDQFLTYEALDQKSTALAKYLQGQGVQPNELVAIFVDRSLDMLVGLLGILKAGGAYVPLDPEYPEKRLGYILKDSRANIIVTQSQLKQKAFALFSPPSHVDSSAPKTSVIVLDEQWADIEAEEVKEKRLDKKVQPCDLAYVIYTSGSTGNPKGVMIPHRGLTNFLISMAAHPGLQKEDKLLAVTTYCFDIAGLELYLPIIKGAQCHICDARTAKDAAGLKDLIQKIKPTIMQATPSTWVMLFHTGWQNEEDIKILCGGEALPDSLKQHFVRTNSDAWNLFGPTETTIWSTIEHVEKDQPTTIGKPIANTEIYILDNQNRLTPMGIAGELCIAGDGLAKGYFNKPDLTAEKFIDNPFKPGSKLYRTGDLARWLADGTIEYLGRMDFQVKIHGFRIELGEIESRLNTHPHIKESVVIVKEQEGLKQLVAYYVFNQKDAAKKTRSCRAIKSVFKSQIT